jgi:hypothetical protein
VAILPELEDVPRQYLKQQVGQQLALWEILFTGQIKGRDDLELIFLILRGDVEIPIQPLWDPAGIFISALVQSSAGGAGGNAVALTAALTKLMGTSLTQRSNPSWWAINFLGVDPALETRANQGGRTEFNNAVREAIARRVFPNLRNRSIADVKAFIASVTARELDYFEGAVDDSRVVNGGNDVSVSGRSWGLGSALADFAGYTNKAKADAEAAAKRNAPQVVP